MDMELKMRFEQLWAKYFPGADLPIAFFYTDDPAGFEPLGAPSGWRCVIADLAKVRKGQALCLNADSFGCPGGKRYSGFSQELMPGFEYFLSCGIPGKMEGERYKKSPELVQQYLQDRPAFTAPADYLVFKRWDKLDAADEAAVVIFFAAPDVLAGLFTLAHFDSLDPHAVIAPFCSGCSAIIDAPYHEIESADPKAVLGMFDVSARPYVAAGTLTFAVPMNKFVTMVNNAEESFLITESWNKVRKRIEKQACQS
ncbi:MAG: DUF169 domain-containing protein [Phycisphaerae bacterium]|nr:DUF169 domain-containing protein [Phycisphaerae bacterium]